MGHCSHLRRHRCRWSVLEPFSLSEEYIEPEFRERRPRMVIDENGKERLSVEGKLLENLRGIGSLGAARLPARHRLVDLKLSGQAVRGVPVPTTPDGSELRFAMDSPVEGDGFEPSVPRHGELRCRPCRTVGCEG